MKGTMTMNDDATPNPARGAKRQPGRAPGAVCMWCGASQAELKRFTLQSHHVASRANDPVLTILLCPSCHDRAGELLRKYEVNISHSGRRSVPEALIAVLVGIALTLIEWGKRLLYWAYRSDLLVAALDANYPQWRLLAEAQL